MQENIDPAIKLFGMEIPVTYSDGKSDSGGEVVVPTDVETSEEEEAEKESLMEKVAETLQHDDAAPSGNEEAIKSEALPESNVSPKTPSIEEESTELKACNPEKEPSEATTGQEKTLKKPDKILPCPRCNSMDTKFCYYNNYNVNQPRHFCKACQRYWTAGGTMRNVPVGAGRRKSKNSSSNYRHISISEASQAAQINVPNGTTHPALKTNNGGVLSFGYDAPIWESMASVLNLTDKNVQNGTLNGFHKFQEVSIPCKSGEIGDDCSNGSSVPVSKSMEKGGKNPQEPLARNINGFPAQMPCLPGPGIQWPYPWTPAVPPPVFCPPGFPMPFHPAAYWNCTVPTPWNIPWLSPQFPSNEKSPNSSPNSPLGKHSRDGKMLKPDGSEEEQPKQNTTNGSVLVPKTLRIDDPAEAAKSSIWTTLGIKNESISGGRMFKGFESKKDEKNHVPEPSPVLRTNPAALSRSLNFQESV